jgi:hypothetical protein
VPRIEAGIQAGEILESPNEQTSGQDQYDPERHFGEHESLPPPLTAAADRAASAFREGGTQTDGGSFERREKPEEQTSGE